MQQVALPSLYDHRRRPAVTQPFPLVQKPKHETKPKRRRLLAGVIFGTFMSMTLVLLGYEARVYWDSHPGFRADAVNTAKSWLP